MKQPNEELHKKVQQQHEEIEKQDKRVEKIRNIVQWSVIATATAAGTPFALRALQKLLESFI